MKGSDSAVPAITEMWPGHEAGVRELRDHRSTGALNPPEEPKFRHRYALRPAGRRMHCDLPVAEVYDGIRRDAGPCRALRRRAGRTGMCPVEENERHVPGSPRHRCPGGLSRGDPLCPTTRPSYRPTPEPRRWFRPGERPGFATVPVTFGRRFPRRYLLLLLATAQRNISRWDRHPPERSSRAWGRSRPRRAVPGSAAAQTIPGRARGKSTPLRLTLLRPGIAPTHCPLDPRELLCSSFSGLSSP